MDVSKLTLADIATITLDTSEDTAAVVFVDPSADRGHLEYSETLVFNQDTPQYLKDAAKVFADAILRAVHEGAVSEQEVPCKTCIGSCCMKFPRVVVTAEDVTRMRSRGMSCEEVQDVVEFYDGGDAYDPVETWTGAVGQMRFVPRHVDDVVGESREQCIMLQPTGCSIYEHRPGVCRAFSAWNCGEREEDPAKVDGRVRLRVVT